MIDYLKIGKYKIPIVKQEDCFILKNENSRSIIQKKDEPLAPIFELAKSCFDYAQSLDSSPKGKRNLIYFTLGCSIQYSELLTCCLRSIVKNTKNYSKFDVLIIHDDWADDVDYLCAEFPQLSFKFLRVRTASTGVEASMNKLRIFDFPDIENYNKVLFLDADIVVNIDIASVFDLELETTKLHSTIHDDCHYSTHNTKFHTIRKYFKEEIEEFKRNEILPFNCGQFMFVVSDLMKSHFENVRFIFFNWKEEYFFEQSFMNYYFNSNFISDTKLMNDLFSLYYIGDSKISGQIIQRDKIVHYAGSPCDSQTKLDFVKEHFKEYL
jgi:lipopolysaccharide biosynthesis glycosyltransferase